MKILLLILIVVNLLVALDIRAKNYNGDIKFLKQVKLDYKFKGYNFSEISALAYNRKTDILYMVSDKGVMFKFKAKFTKDDFSLTPINANYFKRKNGKRLRRWRRDTEGIAIDTFGNIFVSREGKPKVTKFSENGVKIANLKLPKSLKEANLRSKNKSLESLTYHPKYGLLTALELPPEGVNIHMQTIYALNGKRWHFKSENYKKNGVTDIEVTSDNNLLVLERSYNGFFGKFVVTIKKVYINGCKSKICPSKVLLTIDSAKGWSVENFEGLVRVDKDRYLMVSDDNDNFFQTTLLIYFELKN